LHTLPLHLHEVLASFLVFTFINDTLSPRLSTWLLGPARYPRLPRHTQAQWDMHFTSLVNATMLSLVLPYVLLADEGRANATWEDRLWGYTGAGGLVQAVSAGYFLWDVKVCAGSVSELGGVGGGLGLLHAVVGLCITVLGFRPFGLYYGMQYGLVELSTPFVNIHWFLNKTGRAGSLLQVVNGIILVITFACCRLLWGAYMTTTFFGDVWTALQAPGPSSTIYRLAKGPPLMLEHRAEWWVGASFMCTHAVVMGLSAFWFAKMVRTMRGHIKSRGTETEEKKKEKKEKKEKKAE
ncbi:TLC domain-containing protein, partial [Bombardia bombarda]